MASINIAGQASLGNALQQLLQCDDIIPGSAPSYQTAKAVYAYHPFGAKLADYPISMAQSQDRKVEVVKGPKERLVEAYQTEWDAIGADRHIFNIARLARVYGIASIALLAEGVPTDRPVDYKALATSKISFNVLDPLNTSGSLVLSQDPNSMDFLKTAGITVSGQPYHRSRTVTLLNEDPIYIEWTTSAFGYVGRSIYQRSLFPLKSFINTMTTDDLVALKAGVLIAKLKNPSSAIDNLTSNIFGQKRAIVQEAQTGNVINIGTEEDIESLNLQNIDGAFGMARKDIIENIATGSGTPAKIILAESFAEGFGEGTEDAKYIAQFIDRLRIWMEPVYAFFDKIVQYRAWNPEFYKTIQADFAAYRNVPYQQAFYEWVNSFSATWPKLNEEPASEAIKVEDTALKAVIAAAEIFLPIADPVNKARFLQTMFDTMNTMKMLFPVPFEFDAAEFEAYVPPQPAALEEPKPAEPFSAHDSASTRGVLESLGGAPRHRPRVA